VKYSPNLDERGGFAPSLAPDTGGGAGSSKGSTPDGKSGRVSEENEQDSPFKRETAEASRGGPGDAEKLTRDELGRVARADAAAGRPEYDVEGRYNRETEALARLREREPSLAIEPNPEKEIGGGAEHLVELAPDPARVLKHTRDGEQNPDVAADFGYAVDSVYDLQETGAYKGTLILRPATPSEYVHRMDAQNEVFGSDLRIEGITKLNNRLGLAVSQTAIKGEEPSAEEIKSFMEDKGFEKVSSARISNEHMMGKTWYDAKSRTLVSDVKPDNLKGDVNGRLRALDLIVHRLPEGSDIHDILTEPDPG
jgi:hypothetical protein